MKAKKVLYLFILSLLAEAPIVYGFSFDNNETDPFTAPFRTEADLFVDPFGKDRDFSKIHKVQGEDKCHDLCFKSIWGANYSVYIWKHKNNDVYEIKSSFSSDIENFLAVTTTMAYNLTDVDRRKDGREHVKFRCEDFINKLTNDTEHMTSIT